MKRIVIFCALMIFGFQLHAQKHMTQNGVITFFSSTPIEDIEATNNQVSAVINAENGDIAAMLLMKAFNFEKALMQEHFNEKYVESDKFPKSVFKGQIKNLSDLQLQDVKEEVLLKGDLTIHGVTKTIEVNGTISQKGSVMELIVEFEVNVDDFDIKIPGTVKNNIAETIKVNLMFNLDKV